MIQNHELLKVLVFGAAVASIYSLALLIIIRSFRRGGSPATGTRLGKVARGVILLLAAGGLLCMAYGYWIEPHWPEVRRVRIAVSKIPAGSRGARIVHLSDLHCESFPGLEERLPDLVAAERPDFIVFTGDSMNTRDALPVLQVCLRRLAAIAPTYAVRGNWDTRRWGDVDLFGETGVRELDGEGVAAAAGGAELWIAGVAVDRENRALQAIEKAPPLACTVLLYHFPDPEVVPPGFEHRVDLICSGHTHGGQVALPWYGAIITLSRWGKRYESGLYDLGGRWMYVNRGIGMDGGRAPRVRFFSRPEITVIELGPSGS